MLALSILSTVLMSILFILQRFILIKAELMQGEIERASDVGDNALSMLIESKYLGGNIDDINSSEENRERQVIRYFTDIWGKRTNRFKKEVYNTKSYVVCILFASTLLTLGIISFIGTEPISGILFVFAFIMTIGIFWALIGFIKTEENIVFQLNKVLGDS
jgi:hypothetical protein